MGSEAFPPSAPSTMKVADESTRVVSYTEVAGRPPSGWAASQATVIFLAPLVDNVLMAFPTPQSRPPNPILKEPSPMPRPPCALVLLLAVVATAWSLPIKTQEIATSGKCRTVPDEILDACRNHSGKHAPFRYSVISDPEDCDLLRDSTARATCRTRLETGSIVNVASTDLASIPQIDAREDALERIAFHTKVSAIFDGIQMAATAVVVALAIWIAVRD